jgi:hypothetical protein
MDCLKCEPVPDHFLNYIVMHDPMTTIDMSAYDFRLLDVSGELYALEDHLQLIEEQMQKTQQRERLRVDEYIRKKKLSPHDYEWNEALDEYNHRIDCLLPRFFRGPFLVALYAVYESAVTEIACLIQEGQSQQISVNDLKGDFLEKAKKYYKHILCFELYAEEKEWHRVKMLSELRNAFAHVNGRIEMLNQKPRKTIKNWERQNLGISTYDGFIVCDSIIVADIFDIVRKSLENLVSRYKTWDDRHSEKA